MARTGEVEGKGHSNEGVMKKAKQKQKMNGKDKNILLEETDQRKDVWVDTAKEVNTMNPHSLASISRLAVF